MEIIGLMFILVFSAGIRTITSFTDPQDVAVMQSLKNQWDHVPPSWKSSNDPCAAWEGVGCNSSRVTSLGLSTMGLVGKLNGDIGGLSELRSLDLSYNKGLTGSLSPSLGDLKKLSILILAGCGFSGTIPSELGGLTQLSFLALNSNNFSGEIPPSLGRLSNVYWLDLADNQLTGSIPVSSRLGDSGLDQLWKAKHFHFNKNQLSGTIPPEIFNENMILIHVLFDGNLLEGNIPESIGLVHTLEVLRLDRNSLSGEVPDLSNLTNLNELNLAHNNLSGPVPDLSTMAILNYVDLSNNSFNVSEPPKWFSSLQDLTTLIMEYSTLEGSLPSHLFGLPNLEIVRLRNNNLGSSLNMSDNISQKLVLVDLQNNQISTITLGPGYKNQLILIGNPACASTLANSKYCQVQQPTMQSYSTSLANCGGRTCPADQKLSPQSCECAYPYEGTMYFRGPSFGDVSNADRFHSLELSLWTGLELTPGSVALENAIFNNDGYLQVQVALFPSDGKYFNRTDIQRIGFDLSNQTYKPPMGFGPYLFIAAPYAFPGGGSKISTGIIVGIAVGCVFLFVVLVALGIYAIKQKKRAERAIELSKPFASWVPSGKDSGGAPQLKGARWFSYDELKKCTNHFSESNEIGSGGYGKVYRGLLPDGQVVAIKRAQQGSTQGGLEFKTEIELLSRVHHKNLVGLVGFCFEQGEQMLIYEFMPNGTLRESLSGRSGIYLDWKRRLRIALGSARGLAYLHELANPPIIHRDVKSTNILLDEKLIAKVADFGLSKLVSDSAKGHVSTQVKGTLAIMDPPIRGTSLIGFGKFLDLAMACVEESAADRPTMSDIVKEIETILQNDGINTNSTSASSSATEFANSKATPPKHPYDDAPAIVTKKDVSDSDAFDYSGGYTVPAKVEPK
ncbi:Leucine-rich repeat-containing N-terminal, plant-type [Dillenia turbinata]|uniref:non-specific serine/threonine protein kinase n=1 Tax=Dillenia turbinata TaxID=194707 RepID=A0AAN8UL56_9MAGN